MKGSTGTTPFDLVIFDLDGTLVDSAPDIAWALNTTLAEVGLPTLSLATLTRFVGDGAAKLIERALPPGEPGRDPAPLLARFLSHYAQHLCVNSVLYPGVSDLLQSLQTADVTTAVITNKPGGLARTLLRDLGIAGQFSAVIGDGDGFPRKPDPAAAQAIIARAQTTSERTIVIGDGLPDIHMARALPCAVIAAAWGYVSLATLKAESPTFTARTVADAERIVAPHATTQPGA